MRYGLLVGLLAVVLPAAGVAGSEEIRDERALGEFFEKSIRPLFAKHCYDCHSVDTAADNGELALDGRVGLTAGGSRGPLFVPGKPEESLLVTALRYSDPQLRMPPEGKISNEEIDQVVKWIQMGAYVPDYGSAVAMKEKQIDWESARSFWAFQPLSRQTAPAIDSTIDLHQPIDAFIRSSLASQNLKPSPEADKRTLIRRLWFDLLGLPPTPEDVAEFVADDRVDAYERLVDRLLASPHFGERWARYWLDLARYTDVTPSWLKNADQAWLYRDWVVQALNADLPYDQFVKQQLAADLYEETPPEDYAALGLLGLSPTYWKELQLAPGVIEVIVADEWDERIDAVTRTFLGLTVACARCHDHKFDPISARDYYALAGVFASTQLTDRPLLPSPFAEQVIAARVKVGELEDRLKAVKDKESEEAKNLTAEIEAIRKSTPQFDARMAHTVEEASLYVMPDGPDRTKLDVRKGQPRDLPVFRRGNPGNPGEIVPRRFLEVLSPSTPTPFVKGSGRREFAEALFHESQALTARVITNRLWAHHFGRGIVKTPSDFGTQGERPSHPELLEWLATHLASDVTPPSSRNWSMKRLHRTMITSTTYRQASEARSNPQGAGAIAMSVQLDPENHFLARMSRRRLDIEPWRDEILAVADNLDNTLGGPAVELDLPTNRRRTLYGKIGRDEQHDMLRLYDFPPPTSHSPSRDATTTPLQQLFVLNSEFIEAQAVKLNAKLHEGHPAGTTRDRIIACYEQLFQRKPSDEEIRIGENFLRPAENSSVPESGRWPVYIQSLFGLNELMFID
ncbi:PSD1 and planctomycete cytochrome C domain-containing protein [Schlesneria sp. DSM 10557]|uniref:PSD1 and planctomycete cytochrome C domain-containing protein n=1 Tax=Schlesneria sp. DSM 10557 TaxID=3044399 RepID=UPI0035A123EB